MLNLAKVMGLGLGPNVKPKASANTPQITTPGYFTWDKDGNETATYTYHVALGVNLPAPTYQWYRENVITGVQTAISGATSVTYVVVSADFNYRITLIATYGSVTDVVKTVGWMLPQKVNLWDINTTTGTTNNAAGVVTYATAGASDGHGSLQVTQTGVTNGSYLQKTALITDVPANLDVLAIHITLDPDPEYQTMTAIDLRPGVGGTYYTGGSRALTVHSSIGKFVHSFPVSAIATFKDLPSSQIDARILCTSSGGSAAPYCSQPKLHAVAAKAGGIPTAILTFDDGRKSIKDWILPNLISRGLVGTFNWPAMNTDGVTFMSNADVKAMYDTGAMEIGVDGMPDDSQCILAPDMATVMAGIDYTWGQMLALGVYGPGRFGGCWPNGSLRQAGVPIQLTSVVFNGTTTVTCASTTGVSAGTSWKCAAAGMPRGTTVANVVNGTTLTLSNPVTSAATVMSVTNASNFAYDNELPKAFRAKGMKFMRQTNSGDANYRFGFGERDMQVAGNSMSNTGGDNTAALMNARIDTAKANKSTVVSYAHNAVDTIVSGLDTLKTELAAHYDYLASEKQAQRIQVLTVSQLIARDYGNIFY